MCYLYIQCFTEDFRLPSANSAVQIEMKTIRMVSANMVLMVAASRFVPLQMENVSLKCILDYSPLRWASESPVSITERSSRKEALPVHHPTSQKHRHTKQCTNHTNYGFNFKSVVFYSSASLITYIFCHLMLFVSWLSRCTVHPLHSSFILKINLMQFVQCS